MIPKCSHWMGHKFEPRYSENGVSADDLAKAVKAHAESGGIVFWDTTPEIAAAMETRTYHHDVCVRCGATVRVVPRKKATEAEESPE